MTVKIPIDKRRYTITRAMHQSDSTFDVDLGLVIHFPGLPTGTETICGFAEQQGYRMPTYTPAEVGYLFFSSKWEDHKSRNLVLMLAAHPCEPGDPHYFAPLPPVEDRAGFRWTLGDVERMIRFLSRALAIDADRTIIALEIVLWTAKGYGLYA